MGLMLTVDLDSFEFYINAIQMLISQLNRISGVITQMWAPVL
jgi:succinate dehydrogenase/fumarate reductase cytochrome b subunit